MKKELWLVSSLAALGTVAVIALMGLRSEGSFAFAAKPEPNAEYTITTWAYDGWNEDVNVFRSSGFSPSHAVVFLFHSTSTGAAVPNVREDIKLAVILSQQNEEYVHEAVTPSFSQGILSLSTADDSNYEMGDKNMPVWPVDNLSIYDVSFVIGDFSYYYDDENYFSYCLEEKDPPGNFTLNSFSVGTTLAYCTPEVNQAGSLEARNNFSYKHTFTSTRETIGNYGGEKTKPHIGIQLDSISVTYGCFY